MNMAGLLNNDIISDFENSFRNNCLILIGEAYKWLKDTKNITVDWNEETISANIFTHINENEKAIEWNINVSDECRLYWPAILNNKKSAKSASRIDLKQSTNWNATKRVCYFIEAKNLIENNCTKQRGETKLNAKKIQQRYISTGIDHFISGEYPPNGCMLGSILEGTATRIVENINEILLAATRSSEILKKNDIPGVFANWLNTSQRQIVLEYCYRLYSQDEFDEVEYLKQNGLFG